MNRLTARQQTVYDYVRDCMISRGYGPTVREIGEHLDIKSPNGVMCHLRALEKKGVIRRTANKSRAIELTDPIQPAGLALEVRGWAAEGAVCRESEPYRQLKLSERIESSDHFLIDVRDDHLLHLQIRRGDKILCRTGGKIATGRILLVSSPNKSISGNDWYLGCCTSVDEPPVVRPLVGNAVATLVLRENVLGTAIGIIRLFEPE